MVFHIVANLLNLKVFTSLTKNEEFDKILKWSHLQMKISKVIPEKTFHWSVEELIAIHIKPERICNPILRHEFFINDKNEFIHEIYSMWNGDKLQTIKYNVEN